VRLRKLLVYRFKTSLIPMMKEKAIKPVLYSIAVKKGKRKIQKAALYAFLIRESGWVNSCLTEVSLFEFFRSHANLMEV